MRAVRRPERTNRGLQSLALRTKSVEQVVDGLAMGEVQTSPAGQNELACWRTALVIDGHLVAGRC